MYTARLVCEHILLKNVLLHTNSSAEGVSTVQRVRLTKEQQLELMLIHQTKLDRLSLLPTSGLLCYVTSIRSKVKPVHGIGVIC